jgi:uncharacterized protein
MPITLVLGASENSERYSYKAIHKLRAAQYDVVAIGNKKGKLLDVTFRKNDWSNLPPIDTITLYIGPRHQEAVYENILQVKPRRVIFNPGTENDELKALLAEHNIIAQEACTLVLLSVGNY